MNTANEIFDEAMLDEIHDAARRHIDLPAGRESDAAYDHFASLMRAQCMAMAMRHGLRFFVDEERAVSQYWELQGPEDEDDDGGRRAVKVRVSNHACRHGGVDISIHAEMDRETMRWQIVAMERQARETDQRVRHARQRYRRWAMSTTPRKIIVKYQGRTGLFPEHHGVAPIVMEDVRITGPAREALKATGAKFALSAQGQGQGVVCYDVTLGRTMPKDLVVCRIPHHYGPAIRLEIEPEWPMEQPDDYWSRAAWMGCPKCGAPLVWYEAGFVPGYRVCAREPHHHSQLS